MKRYSAPFVFISALTLYSSACHAEGLYVGGGASLRHYNLSQSGVTSSDSASGYSLSGKLFSGYEIDQTWAVEGGYVDLGKQSYRYTQGGTSGTLSTDGYLWFAALKASKSVSENLAIFGKLGLDQHRLNVVGEGAALPLTRKQSTSALYMGLGAQYRINRNWASVVELERFGGETKPGGSLSSLSLNLKYNF